MAEVVIGVGTNLGDRIGHLRAGVRALRNRLPGLTVAAVSPIYESDALVPEGAPDTWRKPYLNLAVRARWTADPHDLLGALKALELSLGRNPAERWQPREVDFDLLTVESFHASEAALTLPHPGLLERPFALLPWDDVAKAPGGLDAEVVHHRLARWRADPDSVPLRTRRSFHSLTELVGILNLTPDSFSDGGRLVSAGAALVLARALVGGGASVLDLGAESTRPGADAVAPDAEWSRLAPVLEALREAGGPDGGNQPVLSVDTRHPATARRAVAVGAGWINDVSGFEDPEMLAAVRDSDVQIVAMHSLGIPPTGTRTLPLDRDPVELVCRWGEGKLEQLESGGVDRSRIILDPGIGFGKTAAQSTEILRRADALLSLGVRILIGHSRKSFLAGWYAPGHPGATQPEARDPETALLTAHLATLCVDYVRVHDVSACARALRAMAHSCRSPQAARDVLERPPPVDHP